MNGEALREEQGYPLRAVVPGWEGNLWVKWLRRIEVGDQPWQTREETSKYTDLLADGRSRRFTFSWMRSPSSPIPSPQAPLKYKGRNVLSGLAWSGRGTITARRRLARRRPQLAARRASTARCSIARSRASTSTSTGRARSCMIQSRAMDSTGYVQPSKDELRKVRGVNSIYHNNGIQTWLVRSNGETENVEVS